MRLGACAGAPDREHWLVLKKPRGIARGNVRSGAGMTKQHTDQTKKPLGLAIVGLGMAHKPHVEALRNLAAEVRILHCHAPSAERRKSFGEKHPDLPLTEQFQSILDDPAVDVVLILTPPFSHRDLVLACAKAGKHVLLEKPLDVSTERAWESVRAMEAADLRFGVVFQHRFRHASQILRRLVQSGDLGELVSGSASIRWWRSFDYFAEPGRGMKARDGGGVLLTQAIHTLDLFLSLTGPVKEVAAMARTSKLRSIDTEDVAAAAVEFANGAIGAIDATTVSFPGQPERIELACTKGTAILSVEELTVHFMDGRVLHEAGSAQGGGGADPMAFSCAAHQAQIADFLEAVRTHRPPQCSGRDAVRVLGLIEAMLESSTSGKAVSIKNS